MRKFKDFIEKNVMLLILLIIAGIMFYFWIWKFSINEALKRVKPINTIQFDIEDLSTEEDYGSKKLGDIIFDDSDYSPAC